MSEIVTPTTTFTLDTISVEWAGAAPTPNGQVSLHLYTLGTRTLMPNLATDASTFYFVTTDLLGGGTGLPFFINGVPSTSIVNFTLDNTGTTDQVTLTAGTSYAVEFWNVTDPYSNTPFTWMRTPNATISDPGGQGFAHPNTTDFATSRNTIAANGQAGGARARLPWHSMERRSGGSPATTTITAWSTRPTTSCGASRMARVAPGLPPMATATAWSTAPTTISGKRTSETGPLLPAAVRRVPLQCQNPPPL